MYNLISDSSVYFKTKIDFDLLAKASLLWKKNHLKQSLLSGNEILNLEKHWYDSLSQNKADYSVYESPVYLGDIWTCWCLYSRKSVLALANPKSFGNRSIIDILKSYKSILDLGCGIGFTTLALKELLPNLEVMATNIETSFQFKLAEKYFLNKNIKLFSSVNKIAQVDVIFASEYFEHFESPIEHLNEILRLKPKVLICANTFTGTAIGHFNVYKHYGRNVLNKDIGKIFNSHLKLNGYNKVKTKIWNQKPSVWVKN